MTDDQVIEHDEETGEVTEPLSVQAVNGVAKPKYWNRVEFRKNLDAVDGEGGPDFELAFFEAQSEIDAMVGADRSNPAFKSRYATLAGLLERVRPILTKHRITIKQFPGRIHKLGIDSGAAKTMFLPICTKLTHVDSGQAETFIWEMPLIKVDPQAIGSAATYGRRYAIVGIFGIASVDDDAAAATIRNRIDKEQGADVIETLIGQIKAAKDMKALQEWLAKNRDGFEVFSDDKMERLRAAYGERQEALQAAEADGPQLDIERDAIAAGTDPKGKRK